MVEADTVRLPVLTSSPAAVPLETPAISRASWTRIWVVETEATTTLT